MKEDIAKASLSHTAESMIQEETVIIWQQMEMFNKDTLLGKWVNVSVKTRCCQSCQDNIGGMKQSCTISQHSSKQHFADSEHAASKKLVLQSLCTLILFQIEAQRGTNCTYMDINRSESCIRFCNKLTFTKNSHSTGNHKINIGWPPKDDCMLVLLLRKFES